MIQPLLQHLAALVGPRHPTSAPEALRRAQHYLTEQFTAMGLDVVHHCVNALGGTYRNVIATLGPPASAAPAPPALILAAHYDTVADSPGADDNASGLAVLLEAARALRATPPACPVRFIAFCLEEEDLVGSMAYAADCRSSNDRLCGAIVLECVGFTSRAGGSQLAPKGLPIALPSVGDFLGIVGNQASTHLIGALEQAGAEAVPGLRTVSLAVPGRGDGLPDSRRSDHAAFWDHGYPAVMLTDTANFRNPHYHRPTDTIETLDLPFMAGVTTLLIDAAFRLAREVR